MIVDLEYLGLVGRMVLINIVPFFLVTHLVFRRKKQFEGENFSELQLMGDELKAIGVLGYSLILSIYFFSIPVLQYYSDHGYNILLVEPDGYTVFLIALVSFAMVVCGIYLKAKRRWAYGLSISILYLLMAYAFFSILHYGFLAIVPVVVFSYLLFRLTRTPLKEELLS